MPLLNYVKSLKIAPQEKDNTTNSTGTVAAPAAPSTDLVANIVLDFGYMEVSKIDSQKISNFKTELDNETISVLKTYVSQKAPDLLYEKGEGKTNPFLQ